ncbi:hypothetical protein NNJEOMEG_02082 [Fundidesulfovibrio magnetotacticus]|uniref:Uncharacterized protein n=2 Tax=Fundidesulfovibrio magnetotacticus TaxID=2730080 RepID=A0A6V8LTH8_9BACT|nr:hypothetical protein NNJEOMEG_02082 [Fundidesulfovibrio magnetotacticus]
MMNQSTKGIHTCPICRYDGNDIYSDTGESGDSVAFDCPRCGKYNITGTANTMVQYEKWQKSLPFLSSWTRERNEYYGEVPTVDSYRIKLESNLHRQISEEDSIVRVLKYINHKTKSPGKTVLIVDHYDFPIVNGGDEDAFRYYMKYLVRVGYVTYCDDGELGDAWAYCVRLEIDGRDKLREFKSSAVVKCARTPWDSVNQALDAAHTNLHLGESTSYFQNCAHSCRESLVKLAGEIYDESKHGAFQPDKSSYSNALTKIELVVGELLVGGKKKEERSMAKAAISLANKFAHAEVVGRTQALNCYSSVKAVVEIVNNSFGRKP